MDRPDAIIDLLEADGVLFQCVGDKEEAFLEAEGAGVGDALHEEVPRVFNRGDHAGVRAGGRARVAFGGRIASPLRVLCMRSCAPFCCGEAGRIR